MKLEKQGESKIICCLWMTLDKTQESREKVRNSDNTISKGSYLLGYFRFLNKDVQYQ